MDPLTIAILLYLGALLLAFLDLFLPSGGMLAILAILAAVAAVLFGFRSGTYAGMSMMALVFFSFPVFAFLAIKIWPHTPIGRRVVLNPPNKEDETEDDPLIGCVVRTASPLMPSGQIQVEHRRLNAVSSDGIIIEINQSVKILSFKERNYIVQATQEPLSDLKQKKVNSDQLEEEPPADPKDLLDIPASELGFDSLED